MKDKIKIHEIFHENSKIRSKDYNFFSWIQHINTNVEIRNIISKPNYKFEGFEKFQIDVKIDDIDQHKDNFLNLAVQRSSTRDFTAEKINFLDLSKILFCANGITRNQKFQDGTEWKLRTTPSGGGTYPIEIICSIKGIENLSDGLYFFNPIDNNLVLLSQHSPSFLDDNICLAMPAMETTIRSSSVVFFLVSNLPRIDFKYKARGYRFSLLECGHIAQNILLAAEFNGIGSICIGGYLDDEINDFLKLDGIDRAVQYCIAIGGK
jgi:SagB-type dehydrogenase family enzyme